MLIESVCLNADPQGAATDHGQTIEKWQSELDDFIATTQLRLAQISDSLARCGTAEDQCSEAEDQSAAPVDQSAALEDQSAAPVECAPAEEPIGQFAEQHVGQPLETFEAQPAGPESTSIESDSEAKMPPIAVQTNAASPASSDADLVADDTDPFARLNAIKLRLAQQLENS